LVGYCFVKDVSEPCSVEDPVKTHSYGAEDAVGPKLSRATEPARLDRHFMPLSPLALKGGEFIR